jgi:hypothetical protein
MDDFDILLCFVVVFSVFSSLCEMLLIFGFLKLNELKKHPGSLIVLQCIFQLILHLHWFTIFPLFRENEHLCIFLGSVAVFAFEAAWECNLFICIEVLRMLQDPRDAGIKLRIRNYTIALIITGVCCVLILNIPGQKGQSGLGTCFIEEGSRYEIIAAFPLLILLPCILIISYSFWKYHTNSSTIATLKYNLYVVISLLISLGPSAVFDGFDFKSKDNFIFKNKNNAMPYVIYK